jgi:cell division septation protein DedD
VTRKKDGKSLFEVIGTDASHSDKSMNVPSWFDQTGQEPPTDDRPVIEQAKISPMVTPPPVPSGTTTHAEPMLSVSSGRLVISLNQISAVVVFLAIILLGVGAYMLGRMSSPDTSASPDGIKATYNPDVIKPGTGPAGVIPEPEPHQPKPDGSKMVANDAKRQKGYSYLVIQGGVHTLEEARGIKKFLYEKGVNATIHRMRIDGMYMIKDMHGFRDIRSAQTSAAIAEYVAQIERLGKEYQRQGGRHGFKQHISTGIWMETEK